MALLLDDSEDASLYAFGFPAPQRQLSDEDGAAPLRTADSPLPMHAAQNFKLGQDVSFAYDAPLMNRGWSGGFDDALLLQSAPSADGLDLTTAADSVKQEPSPPEDAPFAPMDADETMHASPTLLPQQHQFGLPAPLQLSTPALGNAHMPVRGRSKDLTPPPPVMATAVQGALAATPVQALPLVKRGVKLEPQSPTAPTTAAVAAAFAGSPSMPPLQAAFPQIVASHFTGVPYLQQAPSSRSNSSAGSNSGGSGLGSDASSGSDSEGFGEDLLSQQQVSPKQRGKASMSKGKGQQQQSGGSAKRKRKSEDAMTGDDAEGDAELGALMGGIGVPSGVAVDSVGLPLVGDKRQQRLQRNRASAQLSRERKKQYMKLLEKQLRDMAEVNDSLVTQVTALTAENTQLKERLARLAMRERVANRYPNLAATAARACQGSPGGSSTASHGSMPGLTSLTPRSDGQDSPLNDCGGSSSGQSTCSNSTPPTPRDDSFEPQTKRVKVAASSNNLSMPRMGAVAGTSSGGAFSARTGMLLFGLVMCVGLVLQLTGMDNVATVTTDGLSRGLSAVRSAPASVAVPAVGSSTVTIEPIEEVRTLVAVPRHGQRVLASLPEPILSSSKATVEELGSAEDAFALVPLAPKVPLADSRALDVYSAHAPLQRTDERVASEHKDMLLAAAAGGPIRLGMAEWTLLQKILSAASAEAQAGGASGGSDVFNATSLLDKGRYLFCPQAMRIDDQVYRHGLESKGRGQAAASAHAAGAEEALEEGEEKQLALFDRAGKARVGGKRARGSVAAKKASTAASRLRNRLPAPALPAPGGGGDADYDMRDAEQADPQQHLMPPLNVGDTLQLWVPLQAIHPSAAPSALFNSTTADGTPEAVQSGMVELSCSISHVRPILLS